MASFRRDRPLKSLRRDSSGPGPVCPPAEASYPTHVEIFIANMQDASRLSASRLRLVRTDPGYNENAEIVNRAALVLVVACWESFVEDLARNAFDCMLQYAGSPTVMPPEVLSRAGDNLLAQGKPAIWTLARDGWRTVLHDYRSKILEDSLGRFHTPKPEQVDCIFRDMIGFAHITDQWTWRGMSSRDACRRLRLIVARRGAIAHRVVAASSVRSGEVDDAREFITKLAVITSNAVGTHVSQRTGTAVWNVVTYKNVT